MKNQKTKIVSRDQMAQMIERFKVFQSKKGLSNRDIARATGYTEGHISLMLSNKRELSVDAIVALNKTFGISSDYILFGKNENLNENEDIKDNHELVPLGTSLIPYFYSFSELSKQIKNGQHKIDLMRIPSNGYIPIPPKHHNLIVGKNLVCISVDVETGMVPVITTGDLVSVDLADRKLEEKQIYLIYYANELKLRYAVLYSFPHGTFLSFWPIQREYPGDKAFIADLPYDPILGRVISVTHFY